MERRHCALHPAWRCTPAVACSALSYAAHRLPYRNLAVPVLCEVQQGQTIYACRHKLSATGMPPVANTTNVCQGILLSTTRTSRRSLPRSAPDGTASTTPSGTWSLTGVHRSSPAQLSMAVHLPLLQTCALWASVLWAEAGGAAHASHADWIKCLSMHRAVQKTWCRGCW